MTKDFLMSNYFLIPKYFPLSKYFLKSFSIQVETSTPKRPASSKPGQQPPPYTTSLAEGVRKLELGKSAAGSRAVPSQQSSEWCPPVSG